MWYMELAPPPKKINFSLRGMSLKMFILYQKLQFCNFFMLFLVFIYTKIMCN